MWINDRLMVEDIRFIGNFPLITGNYPTSAVGAGVHRPSTMLGGILTYAAPPLFGRSYPQTVVFKRTDGPATRGIHAVMTFEGPPEGSPATAEALTRSYRKDSAASRRVKEGKKALPDEGELPNMPTYQLSIELDAGAPHGLAIVSHARLAPGPRSPSSCSNRFRSAAIFSFSRRTAPRCQRLAFRRPG